MIFRIDDLPVITYVNMSQVFAITIKTRNRPDEECRVEFVSAYGCVETSLTFQNVKDAEKWLADRVDLFNREKRAAEWLDEKLRE